MTKVNDLTGRRFGRLLVIKRVDDHVTSGGQRKVMYMCVCSCGIEKEIAGCDLRSGRTTSCGCRNRECIHERFFIHGMRHTKPYSTWSGIKNRCLNKNTPRYKDYGGRGITICQKWREFKMFYEDVSKLPHAFEDGYSIDRIDNDGNYEPGNVKWSTPFEQAQNKRRRSV